MNTLEIAREAVRRVFAEDGWPDLGQRTANDLTSTEMRIAILAATPIPAAPVQSEGVPEAWLGEGSGLRTFTRRKAVADRWAKDFKVTPVYTSPQPVEPAPGAGEDELFDLVYPFVGSIGNAKLLVHELQKRFGAGEDAERFDADDYCTLRDMWDEDQCPSWSQVDAAIQRILTRKKDAEREAGFSGPVRGEGFENGGFAYVWVGKKKFTADDVREALSRTRQPTEPKPSAPAHPADTDDK